MSTCGSSTKRWPYPPFTTLRSARATPGCRSSPSTRRVPPMSPASDRARWFARTRAVPAPHLRGSPPRAARSSREDGGRRCPCRARAGAGGRARAGAAARAHVRATGRANPSARIRGRGSERSGWDPPTSCHPCLPPTLPNASVPPPPRNSAAATPPPALPPPATRRPSPPYRSISLSRGLRHPAPAPRHQRQLACCADSRSRGAPAGRPELERRPHRAQARARRSVTRVGPTGQSCCPRSQPSRSRLPCGPPRSPPARSSDPRAMTVTSVRASRDGGRGVAPWRSPKP
jgi:hypothetical protein